MSKHKRSKGKLGGRRTTKSQSEKDNSANYMNYEVGYCMPPKHSQFKKGQSGNPKGRKKEPATVLACFNKELSKDIKIIKDGKESKITGLNAIVKKWLNMLLSGDFKFMKLFMDKFAQDINIEPYLYPQPEPELFPEPPLEPQSEAVLEVKAWLREAIKERLAKGETIYDDKPKE